MLYVSVIYVVDILSVIYVVDIVSVSAPKLKTNFFFFAFSKTRSRRDEIELFYSTTIFIPSIRYVFFNQIKIYQIKINNNFR